MKWAGKLVVSLRGVNRGFWSHLGCSGQNAVIFRVARGEIFKNYIFSIRLIYLLDSSNQSLKWSLYMIF